MRVIDKIAFVTNLNSHRVAKRGSWISLVSGTNHVHFSDPATLIEDLEPLARRGVTTIFVEGGDGTVMAVLSACHALRDQFQTPPQFALLPGGSTNLGCKAYGFRARSGGQFRKRFNDLLAGAPLHQITQRALQIEGDGFATPQLGFVLSTGTLARAMRYVQTEFHGAGHRGSLSVATAIARFLQAPQAYLDHDGQPVVRGTKIGLTSSQFTYDGCHCLGIMTSMSRLSLGLDPFWGTEQGGIACTYADWPLERFRRGLAQALFWKHAAGLEALGFASHRTDAIELTSEAPIMIDGESYDLPGTSPLRIGLSDPIRFLR